MMHYPPAIHELLSSAIRKIEAIEDERDLLRRTERSALDPHAQGYQDFIDRLFYAMAGISDPEARALEARLAVMQ